MKLESFLESEARWHSDNKYHQTLYILEFKQSSDRDKDFLRVKEDDANEQHRRS